MPHDYLKKSLEKQTGWASTALVMTLMGGLLVLDSFLAQYLFAQPRRWADSGLLHDAGL